MIYATIDGITNELHQLNLSCHNLELISITKYTDNRDRIDIIRNSYEGKKQLKLFERMYSDLKEHEVKLNYQILKNKVNQYNVKKQ